MSAAFTPGPWFVKRDDDDMFQVASETDWLICDLEYASRHSVREANAHLIAAAPELYEALAHAERELAALSKVMRLTDHYERTADALDDLLSEVRVPIAKARGEH